MVLGDSGQPAVGRGCAEPSTRRYYDEHAHSYAEATQSLPLHEDFETFAARLESGARVLDLGCGAGRDLRALSLRGVDAVGLDTSLPLVELAKEFSGRPVIWGDLRSIPFEDEMFAGIWASASLLHLRRNEIRGALLEVSRVLSPNGYFFSSVKTGEGEGPDSRGRWFTYFQPDEWVSLISDAGLTIVDSSATHQVTGTLDKDVQVAWFACTAQKR
jgi:SAM-dependent methyltransferase